MKFGITLNNLHSYKDFGLIITDRDITTPSKIKIKKSVPFLNGYYDFSDINGSECYDERTLKYTCLLKCNNIRQFEYKYMNILKWVTQGKKKPLRDDFLKGYYFLAECEGNVECKRFDSNKKYGYITITFTAYPFKIGESYEGNNLWDDFNFELDVLQDTNFNISGSNNVSIYNNSSTNITPTVICSNNMEVIKNSVTYKFNTGTSKDYRFELFVGENDMVIKGNGSIEFKFRKEVL